ncbi:hypothetical protein [Kluyvera ascorbata]|uniref:hypothetical protein n=2 Tax=Kluyvera ascorbata TaxID=51288 RepID=UPI0020579133|nr:hypothetical protein [Kluyvera ascorbata]MEB6389978.1 hypothetical protein [Kluyvera ascorbata]UPQ73587.1 hypothetical protein MY052_10115 [Kluyvera ascorbata]
MSRHITLSISIVLIKYFSEMNNMSFVNKFITDEKEIQKFDLDNVYNACDLGPGNRKWPEARLDGSDRPNLTIDRERNIWLMHPGVIHSYENSRSGYPEPTGVYVFILHYSGKNYEFRLKCSNDSTCNYRDESPRIVIWQLVSFPTEIKENKDKNQLMSVLKEALGVFGILGARYQMPDTIVRFEF